MRLQLEEIIGVTPEAIKTVQLLRTGNFKYGGYGAFDITPDMLRQLKANYDSNVRRVKIAVDYFHEAYKEAAGWIEGVELRNGDSELWINVDWTAEAVEKIMAKEIRYLSADMDFAYMDIESGQQYGAVLLGAGLTNRPYIKDMQAILSELHEDDKKELKILLNDKKKEITMPTFDEIMSAVTSLSDDEKAQLAEKLGTVKASEIENEKALRLAESAATKKLSDEVASLKKQLADEAKAAKFAVLLSTGKAVEAQRDAYIKGDMEAFLAGSVQVNLSEHGTSADNASGEDAAIKKLNELAEVRVKESGVQFAEAFKVILKENAALAKTAGY